MPQLEYFLVCRSISTDLHTNEITLVNVIEDIFFVMGENILLPRAVAICSWIVSEEESNRDFQAVLQIALPGFSPPSNFEMNLEKGRNRHRAIFSIMNIPVTVPGQLVFSAFLNGTLAATRIVTVRPF